MTVKLKIAKVEDYEPFIGSEAVDRILEKAGRLKHEHVTNVNSTYYGGGVAELLSSLTILMNTSGVKTGWRTITGLPDFFGVTKKMHNALQGANLKFSKHEKDIYEQVVYENTIRMHLQGGYTVIHDPQPLPMIRHYKKNLGPWIWRGHIDFTSPNPALWNYLSSFIKDYDAMIVSIKEYQKANIPIPQCCFMPAIDPFEIKNQELSDKEIKDIFAKYNIPTDLPIVTQISRFDKWKDPEGVIEAFKIARKEVDATLVLLGNAALDDPEGQEVYESVLSNQEERIIILSVQDTTLVNALQSRAAAVLQKSTKEGFGLTVSEAMWKGTPVIGGKVGGIPYQIKDGENGYLVSNVKQAADRIVKLVKDKKLRKQLGTKARKTVQEQFLMTRLMEQYFDLFLSFDVKHSIGNTKNWIIKPNSKFKQSAKK